MIDYQHTNAVTFSEAVEKLYAILTMLRSPEGCPWDREQSPADISRALLDETYEYIDALLEQDMDACSEEIGDVLLNAFMITRMHEEAGDFSPIDAINAVCAKLIRRHPHVFSHAQANDSSEVLDLWNSIKENVEGKKSHDEDFFSRVPKSLPKLEEAWEIQKKMRKVGFDWPNIDGVIDKVDEEHKELLEAIAHRETNPSHVEEELGDLLFAIVNLARYLKISPSVALHRSNRKVRDRFNKLAKIGAQRDIPLSWEHVDKLNDIWEEIKLDEKSR
ncbi:MAG: nucleoside triphosphate pyrophosphohydrolase [Candidatus Wallbacteria bacterium HGW-Wallbacteria-1]|jgi:MazG family protein|uniref:Nucleoside triphosphate pyrophosphohydrolase n=1 Tax=Candidatus Wallbacteria bacterium HGW-Wallbacteria-1 TaxID=2013854 RepID=A0A2N1PI23_9BACT|nr:MAG: nucleoside triphosphate pyrophosphohydrolase [Candidatus Wallbacteria bacterium HGW-Wallbacteria-1]PKL29514.1 MAG: nucleoside triphosphate pyrophosphohydrolase [Spirochaetae bacterium HGW-Spirochaetae-2]